MRFAEVPAFSVPVKAGWPDLSQGGLPAGVRREVRLLHGGGLALNHYAMRLIESDSGVTGQLLAFWPTAGVHVVISGRHECQAEIDEDDRKLAALVARDEQSRWGCAALVQVGSFEACEARFDRQPPWGETLRRLDSLGIMTILDVNQLPEPTHVVLDGVGFEIELRDRTTYRHIDPGFRYFIATPEVARAEAVNAVLIDFLEQERGAARQ